MRRGLKKRACISAVLVVIIAIVAFIQMPLKANAKDSVNGSVPVTYTVDKSKENKLTLKVTGNGSVNDGEENIRNGVKTYMLQIDESKLFEIKPDKGAEIKSITLNGEKISKEEKNILVKGKDIEQNLDIQFEKITDKVTTSDDMKLGIYIIIFMLAVAGGLYFYQKIRKEKN